MKFIAIPGLINGYVAESLSSGSYVWANKSGSFVYSNSQVDQDAALISIIGTIPATLNHNIYAENFKNQLMTDILIAKKDPADPSKGRINKRNYVYGINGIVDGLGYGYPNLDRIKNPYILELPDNKYIVLGGYIRDINSTYYFKASGGLSREEMTQPDFYPPNAWKMPAVVNAWTNFVQSATPQEIDSLNSANDSKKYTAVVVQGGGPYPNAIPEPDYFLNGPVTHTYMTSQPLANVDWDDPLGDGYFGGGEGYHTLRVDFAPNILYALDKNKTGLLSNFYCYSPNPFYHIVNKSNGAIEKEELIPSFNNTSSIIQTPLYSTNLKLKNNQYMLIGGLITRMPMHYLEVNSSQLKVRGACQTYQKSFLDITSTHSGKYAPLPSTLNVQELQYCKSVYKTSSTEGLVTLPDLPVGLLGCGAVEIGNDIYVFGGIKDAVSTYNELKTVTGTKDIYKLSNNVWTKFGTTTHNHAFPSVINQDNDTVLVISDDKIEYYSIVEKKTIKTDTLTQGKRFGGTYYKYVTEKYTQILLFGGWKAVQGLSNPVIIRDDGYLSAIPDLSAYSTNFLFPIKHVADGYYNRTTYSHNLTELHDGWWEPCLDFRAKFLPSSINTNSDFSGHGLNNDDLTQYQIDAPINQVSGHYFSPAIVWNKSIEIIDLPNCIHNDFSVSVNKTVILSGDTLLFEYSNNALNAGYLDDNIGHIYKINNLTMSVNTDLVYGTLTANKTVSFTSSISVQDDETLEKNLSITIVAPTITSTNFTVQEGSDLTFTPHFSHGTGVLLPTMTPLTNGVAYQFTPLVGVNYSLRVTLNGYTRDFDIPVNLVPAVPTITSFTATPSTINDGQSTTLHAVFQNGTGVITPGNIPITSGQSVQVSPTGNTNYTLTVSKDGTTPATASAFVTVTGGTSGEAKIMSGYYVYNPV